MSTLTRHRLMCERGHVHNAVDGEHCSTVMTKGGSDRKQVCKLRLTTFDEPEKCPECVRTNPARCGLLIDGGCTKCGYVGPARMTGVFHACGERFETLEAWQEHVYGVVGDYSALPVCEGVRSPGTTVGSLGRPDSQDALRGPSEALSVTIPSQGSPSTGHLRSGYKKSRSEAMREGRIRPDGAPKRDRAAYMRHYRRHRAGA